MDLRLTHIVVLSAGLALVADGAEFDKNLEVEKTVKQAIGDSVAKTKEEQIKLADTIAQRYGRECLNPIVDVLIENLNQRPTFFLVELSTKVSDPIDRHGMLTSVREVADPRGAILLAAIALPADEQAEKLLMRLATAEYPEYSMLSYYACRFLRHFDQQRVRPAILQATRKDIERSRQKMPDAIHRAELLSHFDYTDSLSPKERSACADFNRRLWLARAMRDESKRGYFAEYRVAGAIFAIDSVPADEQFIRHTLQIDSDSNECALAIAVVLECRLRGLAGELREITKRGGNNAGFASLALETLKFNSSSDDAKATSRPQ